MTKLLQRLIITLGTLALSACAVPAPRPVPHPAPAVLSRHSAAPEWARLNGVSARIPSRKILVDSGYTILRFPKVSGKNSRWVFERKGAIQSYRVSRKSRFVIHELGGHALALTENSSSARTSRYGRAALAVHLYKTSKVYVFEIISVPGHANYRYAVR